MLEARNVSKTYLSGGWLSASAGVVALRNASLKLAPHSIAALVGASGAGKSTFGRCLALLETPDSGEISWNGEDLRSLHGIELKEMRRQIQFVFQQSTTALNPRFSAREIVAEPLLIQKAGSAAERRRRALEAITQVGLPADSATRLPMQFSGGQRQRLAIARALVLRPKLLILDEPFSGLDAITQLNLANLLRRLQSSLRLTYLFILHDLTMAAHLASAVSVIHNGSIVESGATEQLFSDPQHAQTRELINAMPGLCQRATGPARTAP